MRKVVVTGFDPFGGERINPAAEAVKRLAGTTADGVTIAAYEVPTVFGASIEKLRHIIKEEQPELVLCVGQAGGRAEISVERVAINVDDARIPDNAGQQPVDTAVVPGGPVGYWSTLPIKAVVRDIRATGIPAGISQTAGTFVCNHLFYGLMHLLASEFPGVRGGFIHIPFLPEQAVNHPGQPSLSLEHIVQGLQVAVATSLQVEADAVIGGGQVS